MIARSSPSGSGRVPRVRSEVIEPVGVDLVPRLSISWDRWHYPIDGLGLRQRVLDGEPAHHARR